LADILVEIPLDSSSHIKDSANEDKILKYRKSPEQITGKE
jgi:hypothetical protein